MLGNEAIGRGLVEQGCTFAASYPGTPASEVLAAVVAFARELAIPMHAEWSVNEKVALESALAASYTGKRAAVAMKQVGLNVAADPITRSAYLGVKGGLIIVAADDPGPHSSQTEQDSRFFAQFAKIPVLDPISPQDARDLVALAYQLSERYELPVILRPTTRVCHARQDVACGEPIRLQRKAAFVKEPSRWAATPRYVTGLHALLNEKIAQISRDPVFAPQRRGTGERDTCIICSGIAYAHVLELGLGDVVDLYRVVMPYPLNADFIETIHRQYKRVLILEETYPVIERQLCHPAASGKKSGHVPSAGELTPERINTMVAGFLGKNEPPDTVPDDHGKRPSLCAGCGHRAAFYAIRRTFPRGIFPSDIGCYTLGVNMGAVDTCLCMGACISQGAGFYFSHQQDDEIVPAIVVTIGDSTFFHAGIPALINAVVQGAKFLVVILDNSTTAMTGHQPTPQSPVLADGAASTPVSIADIVKACGVRFVEEKDPYELTEFMACLKNADAHTRAENGGMAVIIAKHPCVVRTPNQQRFKMNVTADCNGCMVCIKHFECPALVLEPAAENSKRGKVKIDEELCVGCGVCVPTCKYGAIIAMPMER